MTARPIMVRPWAFSESASTYDFFIGTVGYERRSRYLASTIRQQISSGVAYGFKTRRVLDYNRNAAWFRDAGLLVREEEEVEFRRAVREDLVVAMSKGPKTVLVDVSSMTRRRIAVLIAELLDTLPPNVRVDFAYSVATYTGPPAGSDLVADFGPVSHEFAGWPSNPQDPIVLILGLGYEADRALGVVELLEPRDCWAFRPRGADPRYDRALARANKGLRGILRVPERQVDYDVTRPWETYVSLRALADGLTRGDHQRAIIFPFGPKIFAVAALFVQSSFPAIGVWRVSAGELESPTNRFATGEVVGLSLSVHYPED